MSTMVLPIKCFGVFRQFGDSLSVTIEAGSSIQQLKDALARQLGEAHQALIEDSVLANDNDILPNAYILQEKTALSILPPVCGG